MNRNDILGTASHAVSGARQINYGQPEDNLGRIAALWNANFGTDFDAADVAVAMALLKVARLQTQPSHLDSWVDLAGYAAIGGELATAPIPSTVVVECGDTDCADCDSTN